MCNCMKFTCCSTNHIYVLVFRADLRVDVIYVIMMQKGKEKKKKPFDPSKVGNGGYYFKEILQYPINEHEEFDN